MAPSTPSAASSEERYRRLDFRLSRRWRPASVCGGRRSTDLFTEESPALSDILKNSENCLTMQSAECR